MISDQKNLLYSDKFSEIESFIKQLKAIDPDNKRIKDLYPFLQDWKTLHQTEKKREFIFQGKEHLSNLFKLKCYDKALKVCEELLDLEPDSKEILKFKKKAKSFLFTQTRELSVKSLLKEMKGLADEFKKENSNIIKV